LNLKADTLHKCAFCGSHMTRDGVNLTEWERTESTILIWAVCKECKPRIEETYGIKGDPKDDASK
jgi:hypothetical protein